MSGSEPASGDSFDMDRIRRLIELMEEHDLREIDLKQADQKIRLCRGAEPLPAAAPPAPRSAAAQAPAASEQPAAAEETSDNIVIIKSPMVGTFYSRPNPNAEAYVKIGDMVDPETTICIVEAMKVFNEIPAEVRGRIVATLVDDEEPVEFGRPLFKVDTGG